METAFEDSLFLGRGADGAGARASSAGNAGIRVDHILAIAFADRADGALFRTCTASNALITDNKCHNKTPP